MRTAGPFEWVRGATMRPAGEEPPPSLDHDCRTGRPHRLSLTTDRGGDVRSVVSAAVTPAGWSSRPHRVATGCLGGGKGFVGAASQLLRTGAVLRECRYADADG